MKPLNLSILIGIFFTIPIPVSAFDIGVSEIVEPMSDFDLGTAYIIVNITNYGAEVAEDFTVHYYVDGGVIVTDEFIGILEAGESTEFTFADGVDLSALGIHTICAYTQDFEDTDLSNNSSCAYVYSMRTPFSEFAGVTQFCDSIELDAGTPGFHYLWNTGETTQTIVATNSGVYSVLISDDTSFELSSSIDITIMQSPVASFNYSVSYGTVFFTNTSIGDSLLYQWDFGTLLFSDETHPAYTFASEGIYTVTLHAFNNCNISTTSETIEIILTDIIENNNAIQIYPNPANTNLFVSISNYQEFTYQICDVLGTLVESGTLNSHKNISTVYLASGIYYLQLSNMHQYNSVVNKTFVVQH